MKVWVKYLLGIAFGVLAAFILPVENPAFADILSFLTDLFIRMGRYIVVPLLFTTAIVSINKLRSAKLLFKTTSLTILTTIISTFILTLIGLISILLIKLPRIPITIDTPTEIIHLDIQNLFLSLFPYSAFSAIQEGSFLLVSMIFAFLIGWESYSEELVFKPIFALADSLSKLFYNISIFFTEIMSILMIAIMCNWFISFRSIVFAGTFNSLIIMLIVDFVIVVGIIYPAILKFVCHDPHPYKVLYASIAPLLLSFITGDSNLILPLTLRHARESLGIRRRARGFTFPFYSIFARGGSALTVAISFVWIWRSYSSLTIPLNDILWIFGLSFGLSFLLGAIPSGGAFILLTILCERYGRGFETSFLLLKPATLVICSFATAFDTATAIFGSYIVAVKTKTIEHHTLQHFI